MLQSELRNVCLSNTREQQPSVLHRLKFSVFTNFILLCNYCYLRLFWPSFLLLNLRSVTFNKRTCYVVYVESVAAAPMRHPSGGDPASNNLPSRHSSSSLLSASLMSRSRSSQSLRGPSHDVATTAGATDDDARLTVLVQMFWISVSLLESDFEYEFLLAVRLLDKVSHAMSCCLRRLKYKKNFCCYLA